MATIPLTRDPVAPRISIDQQIAEVERELLLRRKVYPDQVKAGKLRQGEADLCLNRMQAVLGTLRYMREHRETILTAVAAKKGAA